MHPARLALALAVASALVPAAAAQTEPIEPVLTVAPLVAPVPPLQDAASTPFHLDAVCEPGLPGSQRIVNFWVEEAPAWVIAVPNFWVAPMGASCTGQRIAYDGSLTIAVTDEAPAAAPAPVVFAASYDSVRGNVTARAVVNVTAAYFGVLGVDVGEAIRVARPGESAIFRIRVENRGNAEADVRFEVDEATSALEVTPIAPVRLESAQQGGRRTSAEVPIEVHAADGKGYTNEVGVVNIRAFLVALDGAGGDESTISFVLTTRGLAATPAPALLAALALAGAGVARARRPAKEVGT